MNKKTFGRIMSMILAFALVISILPFNLVRVEAEPINTKALNALESQVKGKITDEEQVTVIVQLKEDQVSAKNLKTVDGKKSKMENSKNKQSEVKDKIKNKGIDVKVGNEYSLLINGFSGKTSYSEAKKLASMPEVESVEIAVEYNAPDPVDEVKMTTSVDMIKTRETWNLGFKGEGKLIAIIDSGADPYHQDFKLTNPSKAKYSVAEMQRAISTLGLPGKVFTDKVIYGYNYRDLNQSIKEELQKSGMHGMHVAGTTAANGDVNNGGIKGVAPEAQLIVMRVFSEMGGGTSSAVYLKAIEDATALGVDSMNMSLGSPAGTVKNIGTAVLNAIQKAADIGSIVNIAAGNEGNFGFTWNTPYAEAPDFGIVGTPSIAPLSISVASINNDYVHVTILNAADGSKIAYKTSGAIQPSYGTMYDVVDCGLGKPENFTGKNVRGKIALMERGEINFSDKINNAANNGAVAALIYNSAAGGDTFFGMSVDGVTIPAASIYRSEGLKLVNKPQKVAFTTDMQPVVSSNAGKMSDFSNWGINTEMDIKPELTAPGGNIYSTLNDNQYGDMSGTSMATPHVAGGTALVNERVSKDFPTVTGMNKYTLIKNLLLSTAIPHIDPTHNVPTSPRKQGAGVMNLSGATQTKVIAYDSTTGLAKINKKEVGNAYQLNATLKNYGSTPATYTVSATVQTDAVKDGHMELKPRLLKTVDAGTVTVPANGEKQVTINVDASEFESELLSLMPNGYFLEGFISFKSETQSDLNLPYMGFHGSWNDIPVMEKPVYDLMAEGKKPFYYQEDTTDYTHFFTKVDNANTVLGYYPERTKNKFDASKIVISPNADGKADEINLNATFYRNYKNVQLFVTRENESTPFYKSSTSSSFFSGSKNHFSGNKKWPKSITSALWSWKGLENYKNIPDGVYKLQIAATADFDGATPQISKYYNVLLDTVAPELKGVNYNSSTGVLKVSATDATSGVRKVEVKLSNGTIVSANADGSYTLPTGTSLSNVTVTATDYGYNAKSATASSLPRVNDTTPVTKGSIKVNAVTTDSSAVPSYTTVVKNSAGSVVTDLTSLPLGTYTVTATNVAAGYICDNATQTVTITETAPNANVTFRFHKENVVVPTGALTIKAATTDGSATPAYTPVVKDANGNVMTDLAAFPYGTYKVTATNVAAGYTCENADQTVTISATSPNATITFNFHKIVVVIKTGSLTVNAKTTDGSAVPSYNAIVKDSNGKVMTDLTALPYGTYTVTATNLPTDYICDNPTQTVMISTLSPNPTVLFTFHKVVVNTTKEVLVDVNIYGGTYPKTVELVATDANGKTYNFAPDTIVDGWFVADLPYGDYTLIVKNLPTGWTLNPESTPLTVGDAYIPVITMELNYTSPVQKTLNIVGVTTVRRYVPQYTSFSQLFLPTTVQVQLSDGSTTYLPVTWSTYSYTSTYVGLQTVYGSIQLPADGSIRNPYYYSAKASVQVYRSYYYYTAY